MDREKVIKGLEKCSISDGLADCRSCPYFGDNCTENLCRDALALLTEQEEEIENLKQTIQNMMDVVHLLKEHEVVEPTLIREGWNKHCNDYVCPRCGKIVVYEQNYCSECGVRFYWEGR